MLLVVVNKITFHKIKQKSTYDGNMTYQLKNLNKLLYNH